MFSIFPSSLGSAVKSAFKNEFFSEYGKTISLIAGGVFVGSLASEIAFKWFVDRVVNGLRQDEEEVQEVHREGYRQIAGTVENMGRNGQKILRNVTVTAFGIFSMWTAGNLAGDFFFGSEKGPFPVQTALASNL